MSTLPSRVLSRAFAAALIGALCCLSSSSASAQSSDEGAESDELRHLREFEVELFGGQALAAIPAPGSVRVSDGAAATTTDAPRTGAEEPARVSRDLSWMRGLTLPDIPVRWDDAVIRYLEFFRDDPRGNRFIRAWLRRVDRYGPMIRQQLREAGLPRDLIFVAMVESGFDPTARSHAAAAGMWQFVRRTGEEFGLDVNHWVDRRLDPERSTAAAGRYLGQLHERFGTWELAFAAYNMGYGALLRSIRKYNTNDYWELAHIEAGLPFETTVYVAKIIACAIVAHNPTRFGLADLDREDPIEWERVEVPAGTSLSRVARAAGVGADAVRSLNPSLRRGRTPPGAGASFVRIPPEGVARFTQRWPRMSRGEAPPSTHVLRFGETLADLARTAGCTESTLCELNEIDDAISVGVGTTLLVPPAPRGRARAAETEPPVVAIPPNTPASMPGRRRVFYRVVRGDRLDAVARFFRVRPESLRSWNGIDAAARLQSGMFLQIFVAPSVDLSQALVLTPDECRVLTVGSEEFFAYHEGQSGRIRFRYTVVSGDTLSEIAQRFGIATSSLARINQIGRRSTLRVGQEVVVYAEASRVPASVRRAAAAAAEEETEEAASEAAEATSDAPAAADSETGSGEPDAAVPESDEVSAEASDEADAADGPESEAAAETDSVETDAE